jgi:hypothetical protein
MGVRTSIMPTPTTTKKLTLEIDAQICDEFVAATEKNGRSKRHTFWSRRPDLV